MSGAPYHSPADEQEIVALLYRWGQARDSDDWETLEACFHADATIHISWMSGAVRDFLAGSKKMASARKPGAHTKHLFGGPWVMVNGDRAFSRCHAHLFSRAALDGHAFDFQAWFRFFDRLERRGGVWRILERTGVYEKDRMDAVEPNKVPAAFYEGVDLSPFPEQAKFLLFRQRKMGVPNNPDMVMCFTEGERALKAACEAWLAKG